MNLSVGIVGLPNVGKSTLFNALLKKQQAMVANYPFATIEPNIGVVEVPDERLRTLAEITKTEEKMSELPPIKSATVNFVDIAGLVKGANEGAGLGNKFLSHIREVNVIAHVVRAFTDENVIREGSSEPESDYASIQIELILADLETAMSHEARIKDQGEKTLMNRIIENLNAGIPLRSMKFSDEENELVKQLFFLSNKPEIIVLNVNEDEYISSKVTGLVSKYSEILQLPKNKFIVICAKIEAELAGLDADEQREYLKDLEFGDSGLERLIQKAYEELGLISFLTAGVKEVRAWTIKKGIDAKNAAGEIHPDFIQKFIKAEVVSFNDFIGESGPASTRGDEPTRGGWKWARENGKARLEGKDYIVNDGDVVEFKIGS